MARKPAHIEAASRPTGYRAVWAAIRGLGVFTVRDLERHAKVDRDDVRPYLKRLAKAGYIREAKPTAEHARILGRAWNQSAQAAVYELVRDAGIEAPRLKDDGSPCLQGRPRDQMWRTMKMLSAGGDFNFLDLAIAASTREVAVSPVDASNYLGHLLKAGYLALTRKATRSPAAPARYRLIKNTGPRAPMVQRLKTVWDPNLSRVMWHEEAER